MHSTGTTLYERASLEHPELDHLGLRIGALLVRTDLTPEVSSRLRRHLRELPKVQRALFSFGHFDTMPGSRIRPLGWEAAMAMVRGAWALAALSSVKRPNYLEAVAGLYWAITAYVTSVEAWGREHG